jgi:N-acetylglucosamine-6-phosphate deacetylase
VRLGAGAALVDGALVPGDVEIDGGRIARVGVPGRGRGIAAPGFVDLQVNGFAGVDLMHADAGGYARAGAAMLQTGVTAYLPTFITAPEADILAALAALPTGPEILGAHLEGPFLAPGRLGPHPAAWRRDPDPRLLDRLLATGRVTHVTLAPELPGALELVDALVRRGITVAAGHTDATAPEAHAAFDRGVRTVTHLFNAMRPALPRDPGVALAALARPDVRVQVIADGHHVAAESLLVAWRAARGRIALVTDAVEAAGMGDGTYTLGGRDVVARDGVVRTAEGTLAGSTLTMLGAVRHLHGLGVPLEEALTAAGATPAAILGRDDVGRLAPGARADVVVLDDRLEIVRVLRAGHAPG